MITLNNFRVHIRTFFDPHDVLIRRHRSSFRPENVGQVLNLSYIRPEFPIDGRNDERGLIRLKDLVAFTTII